MYKQLVTLLFNFIIQPEKTWKKCNEEQDTDNADFLKSYLYPVFGIIALFSFAGILFYLKEWNVQIAIIQVIKETTPYFAGYFLTVFVLFRSNGKFFEKKPANHVYERFTGYASAAIYLSGMLYALFPFSILIQLLTIYTFYIIWHGAIHYLKIKEEYLTKFTIFAGILFILVPLIIRLLLTLIMKGTEIIHNS